MDVNEDIEAVSADLPYELQSKMFDQLAALGIAGTGLTVTLIGSILRNAAAIVWMPVIFFALGAVIAVVGNIKLIEALFHKQAVLVQSKLYTTATIAFISMALGSLSMSVYFDSRDASSADSGAAASAAVPAPVQQ